MPATPERLVGVLAVLAAGVAQAGGHESLLPPVADFAGASLELIAAPGDPWVTPAERSGLTETPPYPEIVAWLERLVAASPDLAMVTIGRSDRGRDIVMVVAARGGAATPEELAAIGKPVVLVQAGIHSGEIDGKDAGLMLLRDMTVAGRRPELLDGASLLFVPVLNVDGHERASAFSRINQRGPASMGWRTNARNLNLNRDYAKLETPGVRAIVRVIDEWHPDLYIDVHVTDGVDYQYDITWGYNGPHAWSPAAAGWLARHFDPAVRRALAANGHVPGPLIFAENETDYSAGITGWTAGPRYSNGYGDARQLPTVLVENHSLKPYRQRVVGTYVLLEAALRAAADSAAELLAAVERDRRARPQTVTLDWQEDPAALPESLLLRGIASRREYSTVTGAGIVRWTGEPIEIPVAVRTGDRPAVTVARPAFYFIPAQWRDIVARLRAHGVAVSPAAPGTVAVQRYRLPQADVADDTNPFEGRLRMTPGKPRTEEGKLELAAGDFVVATDQPLGTLAVLLLEPQSPDSFFQWGYFLEIMNRTEYFEDYAIEPLARRMLMGDPELAKRFREKLRDDEDFAADPERRLRWFYDQTPFQDERFRLYPVARSVN